MSSIAHDDSLVTEVREAFEELEHGHAGSVKNSILLQVLAIVPFSRHFINTSASGTGADFEPGKVMMRGCLSADRLMIAQHVLPFLHPRLALFVHPCDTYTMQQHTC